MPELNRSELTLKVQGMYIAYYGRAGDPGGVEFWVDALVQAGGDLSAIIDAFGNSAEYLNGLGQGTTEEQVTTLFLQMFDHGPDAGGLQFYVDGINNGLTTIQRVALDISSGAQGNDKIIFDKKVNAATYTGDVQEMYVAYYGRPGDPGGVDFWVEGLAQSGGDMTAIVDDFGNSAEYLNGLGQGTTEQQVTTLYQQMFNRDPDAGGLQFFVDGINAGVTNIQRVALDIARGAQNYDRVKLDNKVAGATYYTERVGLMGGGATGNAGSAVVTDVNHYPVTVTYSKFATDAWIATQTPGDSHSLTSAADDIIGTSGDDMVSGIINTGATDTVNSGDKFDGGAGTDTLKVASNHKDLNLANTITVKSVEKLLVETSVHEWNSIDIDGLNFQEITLDEGGNRSGGLQVNNVNASSIVVLKDIDARDKAHSINFKTDNTSSVGSSTVVVNDVNLANGSENFNTLANFTAADTVYTTVDLMDLNDGGNGNRYFYEHTLNTGAVQGVAVNTTFNIENTSSSASRVGNYAAFYVRQAGDSVNNIIVNLTNTDNAFVELKLDESANGTSSHDRVTLNLDGAMNSNASSGFAMSDTEIFRVNVLTDSEINVISNNFNRDSSNMADGVVNVNAQADLTVGDWNLSDTPGSNTLFNITGSGNVTIADLDNDNGGNITVMADTATGDISLAGLSNKVVSVTTGSGEDSITVGRNIGTVIQTNGGADNIALGEGSGNTVRYVAATDSQLTLTNVSMSGFDAINEFTRGSDIVQLSSSLGLAGSDMLRKVTDIGGSTPGDMQAFIGNGVGFFGGRATAFADNGTDGYLFVDADNNGNFTEAEDMMIQITGVTQFSTTDIQFG